MIIKLTEKENVNTKYHFQADDKNIVILNGCLYDLTDEESEKFYSGYYMKKHQKDIQNGFAISEEFDLGLYVHNAPYTLEFYYLNIQ